MRYEFRTCSENSHPLRNECVAPRDGRPRRADIRKGWTNVKNFLAPNLSFGACSFLRRGIAQQHLRRWVYLRGISAVGISALVPFRDRIAGTHDRRSAGARTNAAVGRGARDRHSPRRIRARGATAYRGDTINGRWLGRLAEAAHNPT